MTDLGRALADLLEAPMHPDPVSAVAKRRSRSRQRRLAVVGSAGAVVIGVATVALALPQGSHGAQPLHDGSPSPDQEQRLHQCLLDKGYVSEDGSSFDLHRPELRTRRQFNADALDCDREVGLPVSVQSAPQGVPYDEATAPSWFRNRPLLPACGDIALQQGERLPEEASACLQAGAKGDGAELGISQYSEEGDPVITYFRAMGHGGSVDIITDSTRDKFGVQKWTAQTCTSSSAGTPIAVKGCTAS